MPGSTEKTASAMASCNVCGTKAPHCEDGAFHPHRTSLGEPCFRGRMWPSVLPPASVIGWGLGLFLAAFIPFFLGIGQTLTTSMYDDSQGTAWFVIAALMQIRGVVALCIGTYRLVRKMDVGFLMAQHRHLVMRAQKDSVALPE